MSEPRVGPFILRQRVCGEAEASLWLAERVGRERQPRWAAVRLPTDSRSATADRIAHEYAILRELDDPRLPRVLGHFPGVGALAVAWVPGTSLDTAWEAHRRGLLTLQAATVLAIGQELAEVLRHVHGHRGADGRPLTHGRLAGRHVRISRHGRLALLGMGRPDESPGLAALSPEGLAGLAPTPATDQWTLGALLVELLGGERLYTGVPDRVRVEARVDGWVDPIARINPEVGRLLRRLLARDPGARFTDDGELVAAVAHARRGLGRVADLRALGEALANLDPDVLDATPAPTRPRPGEDAVPDPTDAWPIEPRLRPAGLRVEGPAGAPAHFAHAADGTAALGAAAGAAARPTASAAPATEHGASGMASDDGDDRLAAPKGSVAPAAVTGRDDRAGSSPRQPPPMVSSPASDPPDAEPVLEPTEPLGPGHGAAMRAPLRRPATARRLGLGELAALGAVGLLIAAVIYLALVRA